jgi:hypothetical protein
MARQTARASTPRWQAAGSVALGALLLSACALYNGAPLLYADSIDYLLHGGEAARMLFLGETTRWVNTRSFFYALAILPLHAGGAAWPIVAAQAVVTSWLLWIAMRVTGASASPRRFFAVTGFVTLGTSLGWFVGYVMPDLFASHLVLAAALLAFSGSELTRGERVACCALAWFAIVAHGSHLLLAAALAVAVVPLRIALGGSRRAALRSGAQLAALVVLAACSTLVLHRALLGEATISGRRPVFLLARSIADGPGRAYLREHCPELDLAICAHADRLPDNVRDLLWSDTSIWSAASEPERERIRAEEMAVVLAAIRSDPWRQLAASVHNTAVQISTFGMWGSFFPDAYIAKRVREVLPGGADAYFASRQARGALHEGPLGDVQRTVLLASIAAIGLAGMRGRLAPALLGSTALVAVALVANAAVTATLSGVEDRYQARVVWLAPFLAALAVLAWRDRVAARD